MKILLDRSIIGMFCITVKHTGENEIEQKIFNTLYVVFYFLNILLNINCHPDMFETFTFAREEKNKMHISGKLLNNILYDVALEKYIKDFKNDYPDRIDLIVRTREDLQD